MVDVHSKETRSYIMSRIRSKDTKPELIVRRFLHKNGFRYRLHVKSLPGNPDLSLPKYNTVIFVNGCFWHKHEPCYSLRMPKTNTHFWINKISRTVERDIMNYSLLVKLGWKVLVIWECELKKTEREVNLKSLLNLIRQPSV